MVSTFHHDNLNLKMFNSFHINLIAKKSKKLEEIFRIKQDKAKKVENRIEQNRNCCLAKQFVNCFRQQIQ